MSCTHEIVGVAAGGTKPGKNKTRDHHWRWF